MSKELSPELKKYLRDKREKLLKELSEGTYKVCTKELFNLRNGGNKSLANNMKKSEGFQELVKKALNLK